MSYITRTVLFALATGLLAALATVVLREPPAGAQRLSDARAELLELLELVESGGLARGQLANLYGVSYEPPACVAGQEMFDDVQASNLFCPWIEELARRGITGGCTATEYCPGDPVTRAQMASFIVKALESVPKMHWVVVGPSATILDHSTGLPDVTVVRPNGEPFGIFCVLFPSDVAIDRRGIVGSLQSGFSGEALRTLEVNTFFNPAPCPSQQYVLVKTMLDGNLSNFAFTLLVPGR